MLQIHHNYYYTYLYSTSADTTKGEQPVAITPLTDHRIHT